MTTPVYGIIFNRDNTEPRPAQASDLSVIGLVLPGDDADETVFPLNEPVDFNTGDPAYLAKLGCGRRFFALPVAWDRGTVFWPGRWREYRADVKRVIGWSMAELDTHYRDEFLAELRLARELDAA
jgi:hypothetical protein